MAVLRLFPLKMVVFPGQRVPLHIFEPRYRQMIQDVLDEDAPFGIVRIRAGREVGGGAIPHETGCTVRVQHVEELPDGRMNIACLGRRRFRIVERLEGAPYLRAEVTYPAPPEDATDPAVAALRDEVRTLYSAYLQATLALHDSWQRSFRMPDDPVALADDVAGQVDLSLGIKQAILEADRAGERLRILREALAEETADLAVQVAAHARLKRAGLGVLN